MNSFSVLTRMLCCRFVVRVASVMCLLGKHQVHNQPKVPFSKKKGEKPRVKRHMAGFCLEYIHACCQNSTPASCQPSRCILTLSYIIDSDNESGYIYMSAFTSHNIRSMHNHLSQYTLTTPNGDLLDTPENFNSRLRSCELALLERKKKKKKNQDNVRQAWNQHEREPGSSVGKVCLRVVVKGLLLLNHDFFLILHGRL